MLALDIIVPVLNRPQNVAPLLASIASATDVHYRVLFVCDHHDTDERRECERLSRLGQVGVLVVPTGTCYARKINAGFDHLEGVHAGPPAPWLFQSADDLSYRADWFPRALAWADGHTGVIGTNDLCNGRVMRGLHSTHSLIRREYVDNFSGCIDKPGVVMHGGYGHEFCDDELVATARFRGAYVHAFDSLVEHMHPNKGRAPVDETYQRGQSFNVQSRALFDKRKHLWTH